MSSKHLSTGSDCPPKVEGKLRLYSMEYCPYAHRARLVLLAKGIPHDIVNVNLINKPEWIFTLHPEGKVPALDTGYEVVVESLVIADYLDEKYPEKSLYPAEERLRELDKQLIQKIGAPVGIFSSLLFSKDKKSAEEWLKEFEPHLSIFEEELEKRGTRYFGGENPGMVDYMLWPWAERVGTISLILKEDLPLALDQFPHLRAWRKTLRNDPAVAAIYHGPEKFYKVVQFKTGNLPPNYDSI